MLQQTRYSQIHHHPSSKDDKKRKSKRLRSLIMMMKNHRAGTLSFLIDSERGTARIQT
jgi:hypothetical protein